MNDPAPSLVFFNLTCDLLPAFSFYLISFSLNLNLITISFFKFQSANNKINYFSTFILYLEGDNLAYYGHSSLLSGFD